MPRSFYFSDPAERDSNDDLPEDVETERLPGGAMRMRLPSDHKLYVKYETDVVHLHNASDRPITDVAVLSRRMSRREFGRGRPKEYVRKFIKAYKDKGFMFSTSELKPIKPAFEGAIMPGETAVRDLVQTEEEHPQAILRWVAFRDVNGLAWIRDLEDGRLCRANSVRARYRMRRGTLPRSLWGGIREGHRSWTAHLH